MSVPHPSRPGVVAVLGAVLGMALPTLLGPLADPAPAGAATTTLRLDGVPVRLAAGTRQVVTVNRTTGSHARVAFWRRLGGRWVRRTVTTAGRIGYGGLVAPDRRRQGTGTTPTGTYDVPLTFGVRARRPGFDLAYRHVRAGDYWVEDNASAYYNRYRNKAAGGFRWWLPVSDDNGSERLAAYPTQYAYAAVIGFNYHRPVRHRGAGIFLHVNGRGATAGCVSVPRWFLVDALARLQRTSRPRIAIGR